MALRGRSEYAERARSGDRVLYSTVLYLRVYEPTLRAAPPSEES